MPDTTPNRRKPSLRILLIVTAHLLAMSLSVWVQSIPSIAAFAYMFLGYYWNTILFYSLVLFLNNEAKKGALPKALRLLPVAVGLVGVATYLYSEVSMSMITREDERQNALTARPLSAPLTFKAPPRESILLEIGEFDIPEVSSQSPTFAEEDYYAPAAVCAHIPNMPVFKGPRQTSEKSNNPPYPGCYVFDNTKTFLSAHYTYAETEETFHALAEEGTIERFSVIDFKTGRVVGRSLTHIMRGFPPIPVPTLGCLPEDASGHVGDIYDIGRIRQVCALRLEHVGLPCLTARNEIPDPLVNVFGLKRKPGTWHSSLPFKWC